MKWIMSKGGQASRSTDGAIDTWNAAGWNRTRLIWRKPCTVNTIPLVMTYAKHWSSNHAILERNVMAAALLEITCGGCRTKHHCDFVRPVCNLEFLVFISAFRVDSRVPKEQTGVMFLHATHSWDRMLNLHKHAGLPQRSETAFSATIVFS